MNTCFVSFSIYLWKTFIINWRHHKNGAVVVIFNLFIDLIRTRLDLNISANAEYSKWTSVEGKDVDHSE